MTPTVLVLAGPTASGKTALAIDLARRFGAEIISADSRQIYNGMPIGTATPTPEQFAAAPHHLIDFLNPQERYSAALFKNDAETAIIDIHSREKNAIVVGGTGFYIRALTGDIKLAPEQDEQIRTRLASEVKTHNTEFLHTWLSILDPNRAAQVSSSDAYRITRALEVTLARQGGELILGPGTSDRRAEPWMAGVRIATRMGACRPAQDVQQGRLPSSVSGARRAERTAVPGPSISSPPWRYTKLILDTPLEELDQRIEHRIDTMLENGLLEEAERIGPTAVAANAVGYPQALAFLAGHCTHAELRANLVRATRRYARRQRTWFRSEPNATWITPQQIEAYVMEHLPWRENATR